MAEFEEGAKPDDVGDHAQYSKSEHDLLAEYEAVPFGYTPIFSVVWSGPYLGALGAFPDIADHALEAKIWNRKGLLPTSILQPKQAKMMEMNPWLRELVCRIYLVDRKPEGGTYTYFTTVFVKFPEVDDQIEEPTREGPRPLIEANNIRVDFESCAVIDPTGVRGHARGLVTKALLERLDGTEHFGVPKVGSHRRPDIKFHVFPSTPGFKVPADFRPPQLQGINAACVDALKDTIFTTAKEMERKLRGNTDASRASRSLQHRGKPNKDGRSEKQPNNQPEERPDHDKVAFNSQINVIPNDDEDTMHPPTNGDVFTKIAPVDDSEPISSAAQLYDIAVKVSDTESEDTELESNKSVTPDASFTDADKAPSAKKPFGKRIRSFLGRLFCCVPKRGRQYSD